MKVISTRGLIGGFTFLSVAGLTADRIVRLIDKYIHLYEFKFGFIFVFLYFVLNIIFFRFALYFFSPSQRVGNLKDNSALEWMYDIYLMQSLFCFHWITESKLFPIPIRTLMIKFLGAKMGSQTFPSGVITDPFLFCAGKNCVIGFGSVLTGHSAVAGSVRLAKIELGNNVTVGGNVLIYPGVKIGDNSIVAGGAVVLENQEIPADEVWGGVPARFIKRTDSQIKS